MLSAPGIAGAAGKNAPQGCAFVLYGDLVGRTAELIMVLTWVGDTGIEPVTSSV